MAAKNVCVPIPAQRAIVLRALYLALETSQSMTIRGQMCSQIIYIHSSVLFQFLLTNLKDVRTQFCEFRMVKNYRNSVEHLLMNSYLKRRFFLLGTTNISGKGDAMANTTSLFLGDLLFRILPW